MNNYVILTDSSADLSDKLYKECNVECMPLSFLLDGKSYLNLPDESTMRFTDFYAHLRGGKNVTTSAVNVETFRQTALPFIQAGKDILYLGFSSGLSGTYSACCIAAKELMEEYPERRIICIDTLCASMGQGLLVFLTAQKRQAGASLDEAAAYAESCKLQIVHWFTVDDLFFLKRGGRVNAATALVGSALGIKPVLHVDDEGHLINVAKARGRRKAISELLSRMKETAIDPANQTVFISHGDCPEDAEFLAEQIRKELNVKNIVVNYIGPVIGAHAGPGTIALFFLGTER